MIIDILHAFAGWTWEYVEDYMTVPRINAIVRYWGNTCPPQHHALAAFIGFKPKEKQVDFSDPKFIEEQEKTAEAFMKMFPRRASPPRQIN